MGDNKKQRLLQEMIRIRNVSQAEHLARHRDKYKRDTILHSARIISIDPNKKCPVERQLQQGHTHK